MFRWEKVTESINKLYFSDPLDDEYNAGWLKLDEDTYYFDNNLNEMSYLLMEEATEDEAKKWAEDLIIDFFKEKVKYYQHILDEIEEN